VVALDSRVLARLAVLLAVAAACLAVSGAASAATFCVYSPPGCVGTSKPSVSQAVTDAASGAGRDRIVVGAGAVNDSFNDAAGNPVDIVGQGAGVGGTELDLPAGTFGATLAEPTSTVQSMALKQTNLGSNALDLSGTADHVQVTGPTGDTIAVKLETSSTFRNGTITNVGGQAVELLPGSQNVTIADTSLSGYYAIFNEGQLTGRRLRISTTNYGLEEQVGSSDLQDVLITLTEATARGLSVEPGGGSPSVSASHLTIVGTGSASQTAVAVNSGGGFTSTIDLSNSIIRNVGTALQRHGNGTDNADLTVSYSDYDFTKVSSTGPGTLTAAHNLNNVDPQFVNAGAGDYRLSTGSPLIDAGTPGALSSTDSATDLNGAPRRLDGNGDCVAVVDIGAFEFQPPPRAPIARAQAPARSEIFDPVTFNASRSCDPDVGDTLTYQWSFDDGGTATGRIVRHAFKTKGVHTGTVTVRDQTNRSNTAHATVTVTDTKPTLSALTIKPNRITPERAAAVLGATVGYRLSEPASVRFRVQKPTSGRRVGGRCVKPSSATAGAKRCTRWKTLHHFFDHFGAAGRNSFHFNGRLGGVKLKPGLYRLVAVPTDLSGRRGNKALRTFRIKP